MSLVIDIGNTRVKVAKFKNKELLKVKTGLDNNSSGDFLAMDIREALQHIGTITGEISSDELLGNIFANFCIGK